MEMLFMSAGIVVTIVLTIVGIAKLPFVKLKDSHPQVYKMIFTLLSIILAVGLCIVDEVYILCGQLLSIDFAVLICVVLAGVFGGYSGIYEGLGLKELMKNLSDAIKKAELMSKDKKVEKFLSNKVKDIDKAIALLEAKKNQTNNSEV